ncbi:uncharacterized protein MYCGRDRAFT_97782 [Zymoseptoria tritici IPO323]|uniref:Uncharacterized protein n=1 Tax=Zymoseptoria tritici (strain CBS 115943 / IPO323) TaxID=336722 RepID=F9XRD0_ZYMTI|nr:uncharacterized protein MYCGRDRAFT_97782 [Zymoseptoria tritici IPO323]EGP82117.1 hypothetical protein MYCGRDRAFT_97782 [Zymoseptoria tritici IPO323]
MPLGQSVERIFDGRPLIGILRRAPDQEHRKEQNSKHLPRKIWQIFQRRVHCLHHSRKRIGCANRAHESGMVWSIFSTRCQRRSPARVPSSRVHVFHGLRAEYIAVVWDELNGCVFTGQETGEVYRKDAGIRGNDAAVKWCNIASELDSERNTESTVDEKLPPDEIFEGQVRNPENCPSRSPTNASAPKQPCPERDDVLLLSPLAKATTSVVSIDDVKRLALVLLRSMRHKSSTGPSDIEFYTASQAAQRCAQGWRRRPSQQPTLNLLSWNSRHLDHSKPDGSLEMTTVPTSRGSSLGNITRSDFEYYINTIPGSQIPAEEHASKLFLSHAMLSGKRAGTATNHEKYMDAKEQGRARWSWFGCINSRRSSKRHPSKEKHVGKAKDKECALDDEGDYETEQWYGQINNSVIINWQATCDLRSYLPYRPHHDQSIEPMRSTHLSALQQIIAQREEVLLIGLALRLCCRLACTLHGIMSIFNVAFVVALIVAAMFRRTNLVRRTPNVTSLWRQQIPPIRHNLNPGSESRYSGSDIDMRCKHRAMRARKECSAVATPAGCRKVGVALSPNNDLPKHYETPSEPPSDEIPKMATRTSEVAAQAKEALELAQEARRVARLGFACATATWIGLVAMWWLK